MLAAGTIRASRPLSLLPLPESPARITAMIRITELSLPLDHSADELRQAIVKRLNISDADLLNFTVF